MTRALYLQELRLRLSHRMSEPELERTMRYYESYFDEAGPDGEQAVIQELGEPERLTRRIMGEQVVESIALPQREEGRKRTGLGAVWVVLLAIFAAPVAIPLSIGLAATAAGLAFAAIVTVAAVVFGALVCIVYGGVTAVVGFTGLLTHGTATALFFMGGGAVAAGVGLVLMAAAFGFFSLCCRGMVRLLGRGLRRGSV